MHKILTILLLAIAPMIASASCGSDAIAILDSDPDLSHSFEVYNFGPYGTLYIIAVLDSQGQVIYSQMSSDAELAWCNILAFLQSI